MTKPKTTTTSKRARGFSLIELMIVVVIVGVLSAIAIPSFQDYIMKSRTTEATEFLGVIRLSEESFRSEFGTYQATFAPSGNDIALIDTNLVPSAPSKDPVAFTPNDEWRRLGARPSGRVRFAYGVAAGTPGNAPSSLGWDAANADFWWVARAVGNLDADSASVVFEAYSATKNIFVTGIGAAADGADEAGSKGWE